MMLLTRLRTRTVLVTVLVLVLVSVVLQTFAKPVDVEEEVAGTTTYSLADMLKAQKEKMQSKRVQKGYKPLEQVLANLDKSIGDKQKKDMANLKDKKAREDLLLANLALRNKEIDKAMDDKDKANAEERVNLKADAKKIFEHDQQVLVTQYFAEGDKILGKDKAKPVLVPKTKAK